MAALDFTEKEDALEIMEFQVGGNSYGINIAKVQEVVKYSTPTPSPDQNPCIEGIFMLRGNAIPIVDLSKRLSTGPSNNSDRDLFIITSFNHLTVGLHVHAISGIRKLSWSKIDKPDETITRNGNCITTGIINDKDKIIILLDFEKIVADINPQTTIQVSDIKRTADPKFTAMPILIVDDSSMLVKLIHSSLKKAGFTNISCTSNGQEAWNYLEKYTDSDDIKSQVSCVITDIEMPLMDGFTLCKKIKSHNILRNIPVVLFSSIIDETMMTKGREAGADAQMSKPQINELVSLLEGLM